MGEDKNAQIEEMLKEVKQFVGKGGIGTYQSVLIGAVIQAYYQREGLREIAQAIEKGLSNRE